MSITIPSTGIPISKNNRCWVFCQEAKEKLEAAGFTDVNLIPEGSIKKLTDEEIAANKRFAEVLETEADAKPDDSVIASNDPRNLWGEVVKAGKIVARIYRSGCAETPSYMQFSSDAPAERAQEIIKRFGGTLVLVQDRNTYFSARHLVPTCDWLSIDNLR
jgi:hypothetical protein